MYMLRIHHISASLLRLPQWGCRGVADSFIIHLSIMSHIKDIWHLTLCFIPFPTYIYHRIIHRLMEKAKCFICAGPLNNMNICCKMNVRVHIVRQLKFLNFLCVKICNKCIWYTRLSVWTTSSKTAQSVKYKLSLLNPIEIPLSQLITMQCFVKCGNF